MNQWTSAKCSSCGATYDVQWTGTTCSECDGGITQPWRIVRHSGRNADQWHVVWTGSDEAKAMAQYTKRRENLRQGGLRLYGPKGFSGGVWAPRLRTRW